MRRLIALSMVTSRAGIYGDNPMASRGKSPMPCAVRPSMMASAANSGQVNR
jgi:hypothetical protein